MKRLVYAILALAVMFFLILSHRAAHAQEGKPVPEKVETKEPPPPPPDRIWTKDGSIIFGKVLEMTGDVLKVETAFDGAVEVKWGEVKRLETHRPLPFALKDGGTLQGTVKSEGDGEITVKAESIEAPTKVKLSEVAAINAPPKKEVTYKGSLGTGGSISRGNSRTRTTTGTFDFQARSKKQRLTINGYVNYADDGDRVITRNSRASFKYDFFLTDRIYLYAGTFFEGDTFQDLTLRAALSSGVGLEIIKADDIGSGLFKGLEWDFEAGAAFFVEDYRRGEDEDFVAARWATRLEWPIIEDRLKFFHMHEGYPSLDDRDDIYVLSQTGLRMTIVKNFVGSVQVNHRWDNTPKPTFDRLDTLYLWTLGYSFSF